jgi:hypothetical protein
VTDRPGWGVNQKIDAAEKNLARLLDWIGRFDTKTSVLLGVTTGMLGVLASFSPTPSKWTFSQILWAITAAFPLALAFWFIYYAAYPRTKGPAKSLVFFGSIAKNTFSEYRQQFISLTPDRYLEDILEQCHRNSEIIDAKFVHLKRAYICTLLALLPWGLTIYLFKAS